MGDSIHALMPGDVIAQIEDWSGADVRWEELGGGITNRNYIVWVEGVEGSRHGGKYVLRIPGEGIGMTVDREVELHNHKAAAEAGVSPPLLYCVEPGPCTVVPFIEGDTMHPQAVAGHPVRVEKIVRAIKTYHDGAVFANEVHVFDAIRKYTEVAREVGAPRPAEFDYMYSIGELIEDAMTRDEPPLVACHCDLLSENFILDTKGKMCVIDWEYGGMADPYFDLGDFCVEHPLSIEEEKAVLTWYCGEMDEHRYYRMLLHKLVADLWWSIWPMIQVQISEIDFDFYAYGMNRIRRFCRNAANPNLEKWISGV